MAETIPELIKEQEVLRKRLDAYENRFVRLKELDSIDAKVAELDARLTKLEKAKTK